MKLAEALQERSDLTKRIQQLRERLKLNAVAQEGVAPAEDPCALLQELNGCLARLEALITRINRTNSQTMLDSQSLTALLARRDCLLLRIQIVREAADAASSLTQRYSKTEILQLSALDVKALRTELDELSAAHRKLDNAIQAVNWATDLME